MGKQESQQGMQSNVGVLLTRLEACELLRVTEPTLRKWTKEGVFQSYRIGAKVLYKKDELLNCLPKVPNRKTIKAGQ